MEIDRSKTSAKETLTDLILEFLEATVHEYLFAWHVYPKGAQMQYYDRNVSPSTPNTFDRSAALIEVFEQRVLYDVPIHMSRHPLLCEYIYSMLNGCRTWLLRGKLEKLCVILLSKEGRTLNTLAVEPGWSAAFIEAAGFEEDEVLPLVQLEETFRAGMVALVATATSRTIDQTESNKPHTFRILAQSVEEATNRATAINDDNASNSWVLVDPFWHDDHKIDKEIFPVKTIQSEALPVRLNIYMENHRPISTTEVSE